MRERTSLQQKQAQCRTLMEIGKHDTDILVEGGIAFRLARRQYYEESDGVLRCYLGTTYVYVKLVTHKLVQS